MRLRRSHVFKIVTSFVLAMLILTLTPLGSGNVTVAQASEGIEIEDGEELLLREMYWNERSVGQKQIDAARAYAQANIPQGGSLPSVALKAGQKAPNFPYPITNQWLPIGPAPQVNAFDGEPQSGRVSEVAIDKTTSGANQVIYAAAANGGVWKTVNNGATWTPTSDKENTLAIGSLAIDPNNNQVIYAGTGESFKPCFDCYRGSGVLKSTNGGGTWTLYGTDVFGTRNSGIARIRVNKNNSNEVWAASTLGLAKSSDAGVTWALLNGTGGLPAGTGAIVTDEIILDDSVTPAVLYTVYRSNGVYKSTDGGTNWTKLTSGLPAATVYANRTRMAISPSNPQVLYSVTVNAAGASWGATFNESYWTTDGGATWSKLVAMNQNFSGSQGWYDLDLTVDPLNDNVVYFGGIDVFVATNARGTAATGGYRNISNVYTNPNPGGIHPDQHSLQFAACSAAPCRLYVGNDGGVFYTDNGTDPNPAAVSYTNLNTVGFAITEFMGGDIGPNFATDPLGLGGTQDNGTMKYTNSSQWTGVRGGDGGFAKINWQNPQRMYHTYFSQAGSVTLYRSDDGGGTWVAANSGIFSSNGTLFYTNYNIDRSNPDHMLIGTTRMHESFDGGLTWEVDSADLAPGTTASPVRYISTMAVAPSSSSIMYAGTNNSKIFKATNGGTAFVQSNWTEVTPAGIPADVWHNEFWIDPTNANVVYVVGGRFTRANGIGTAYKTVDGGATWTSVMGNLPNLPLNSIISYDSVLGRVLVVGNDIGVFFSTDDGVNWTWANAGFPNTAVAQLAIDVARTTILAYTHGRSVWKTSLPQGPAPTNTPGPSPTATSSRTAIPSPTASGTPTYFFCNALTTTASPTYDRAATTSTLAGGSYYYNALNFTVSTTGSYNLFMTNASLSPSGSDGFYNLYQTAFNPASPLTNIVAVDDDTNGNFQPRITTNLTAGTTYILVGTTYDPLYYGRWTDNIQGAGTVNATCNPPPTPSSTPTSTATGTPKPPQADTIGVYDQASGLWYLRNSNTNGVADIVSAFGGTGDLPVVGDWNNDDVDTLGVYRPTTGQFFLSNSNISPAVNYTLTFGNPGDAPLAGHWDNTMGGDGVGVYRDSNGILYLKRDLTTGFDDYFMIFGNPGDVGFAGDWNGDGVDATGVYRPSTTSWYLNDFNGAGIAFAQNQFAWDIGTTTNNKAFAGDWNGDAVSTVGFYNNTATVFTLHATNATAGSDITVVFGPVGSLPVAGRWVAGSQPPRNVGVAPGSGGYANPDDPGSGD